MMDLAAHAESLLAQLVHDHPLPRPPHLEWANFRTTAGIADFRNWRIRLSRFVLQSPEQVDVTLRHEYAHLLAFARFGPRHGRGHGPAWQAMMRELGLPPQVTHRYPVQRNRSHQIVVYRCLVCNAEFERKRRLPRKRKYMHRDCGGQIEFREIRSATQTPSLS